MDMHTMEAMRNNERAGFPGKRAILHNRDALLIALESLDGLTFHGIVENCCARPRNLSQKGFDYFNHRADKANKLVSVLQRKAAEEPSSLDDILCILHESGSPSVQDAAAMIARDYQFSRLTNYEYLIRSQQKAKWYSRVLMLIIGLVIGAVLLLVIFGFASEWIPKIAFRILIYGLTFVALIAVAVGLIVAFKNGQDISKLQFLTLGILAPFLAPIAMDILKKLSE